MITVHIPTPLRRFTGNSKLIDIEASTVEQALSSLGSNYPSLEKQLFDVQGNLRHFINVFINNDDIRLHDGIETKLKEGDELELLPAIAGGNRDELTSVEWRAQLEDEIEQLRPDQGKAWVAENDGVILDVRTREEWVSGHIPGAIHMDKGYLEVQVEQKIDSRDTPVLVYCASGVRSLFAARTLEMLGYKNVRNLKGGILQWKNSGQKIFTPEYLNTKQRQTYLRHLAIPEIGEAGQIKLLKSKVLIIGAGGLGCPVAIYLAAAGVGTLGIVDDDVVDKTNLQRQILHTEESVGTGKISSATDRIHALNSSVKVVPYEKRLDLELAREIFDQYDIIVDCSDNFDTRYTINDVACEYDKPVVHGSVYRFDGQVSVFWAKEGPCYRCLYPEAPPPELAPPCAEAGVLGVLPGTIGLLQATETIKLIAKIGRPLIGRSLCYDALNASFRELKFAKNTSCSCACVSHAVEQAREVEDALV
ncbi:molybdopterin-synthase adenylyltransferase MoeB [Glaciecola sp. MH2013]|uniref:molybdopterin-synthase adenylyltransferase MoeB n=1 Tax=Glaciecola sp. MH2013 TaxID=2785524 RepID=UPI00189FC50C|nr:molybdopterin-synthase adenylyltransferase MoeB [Glaciecola sp. MH2013]MBF7073474.1 molybdopterin-synthase adenylyltransferase MoeB [Glaciecola sp. MH2013]